MGQLWTTVADLYIRKRLKLNSSKKVTKSALLQSNLPEPSFAVYFSVILYIYRASYTGMVCSDLQQYLILVAPNFSHELPHDYHFVLLPPINETCVSVMAQIVSN